MVRGPILPPSMVDILEAGATDDEPEEEDEMEDYDELLAFLDEDDD